VLLDFLNKSLKHFRESGCHFRKLGAGDRAMSKEAEEGVAEVSRSLEITA
jgi:hypothetical protein